MGKTTLLKMMLFSVLTFLSVKSLATDVTYTFSAQGFTDAQVITSGSIDVNLDYVAAKNSSSSDPKYYANGTNARFYYASSGDGCSFAITAKNGIKITALEIYGVTSYLATVKYNVDGGSDITATLNGTTYSISGIEASTSLKFRNANTTSLQLRITGFKVTYTSATQTPTIALTETTVPNLAASVGGEDPQTINVSGLNLAGNIMLSITGTNYNQFEVTPSLLSQSGGIVNNTPITFKYKPTVTGTHTATLEVASIGAPTITKVLSGTATPTGINDVRIQDLSAFNGKIKFIAEGGENIEVYNSIGQKIINQTAVNGQNTIDLPNVKGMAIVKVGNKTAKVVL